MGPSTDKGAVSAGSSRLLLSGPSDPRGAPATRTQERTQSRALPYGKALMPRGPASHLLKLTTPFAVHCPLSLRPRPSNSTMRLTNLLALIVSASLVLMTDLASAQNLPPSPSPAPLLKLDGIKGTSVADVRPVRADGVEENRAWLPQVIIDWFMNIFKPARLKLLEEQTASRHTVGEIIQASEITQKLVDLKAIKNHPFTTVNIPLDPKMLKLHQKKAVELFKSHEFTALYGRLGKVQGVDKNEKMHHILVHHLGPEQTAFWLHLAKESGNTKVAKVAEAVGDAQFSLWEATGCTHKQCAVRYLKTDPKVVKGLLKEPGLMVRSIVIDFHEYIGRTTLNLVVAPVKTHSHHHGHGHGHHGHGHRGHAHR